ncbi:MAG: ABC transporter permease, partial [Bacteroidota bacterium]
VSPDDPASIMFFGATMPGQALKETGMADFLLLQLFNASSSAIMLLGLFGTVGLIPSLLEKGTVELFLSKPVSRTNLFLSRCAGAVSGIALNIIYFTLGIWLVFGLKVGVWHWGFLASSLLTTYIFTCFFALAAFFGVVGQSTGVAIILAFGFSMLASVLETRELLLYKIWDNLIYHRTLDTLYYIVPQLNAMSKSAATLIGKLPVSMTPRTFSTPDSFSILPFIYSTISAAGMYFLAVLYFKSRDY